MKEFSAFVCLLFLGALALGQEDTSNARTIELIRQFMAESGAPGVAITIAKDNRIILSEGFGYADLEQQVAVRPESTKFRVGSTAKTMTMTAVGRLYEQGKVDLDAPVSNYLPELATIATPISIRQLAGHLGGIRHYHGDEFWSRKRYASVRDGLSIFLENPTAHDPGKAFLYTSYGFNVIGAVVEAVSGRDFLEVMTNTVFGPIGMQHTVADDVDAIIGDRSRYYTMRDGRLINSPPVQNSYKWPSGGFLSTTEDLVKFGLAHLNENALTRETVDLFWTPQQTLTGGQTFIHNGEEIRYGMGWMIRRDHQGRRVIGHSGQSVGGTTEFGIYVESRLVYAISTNMDPVSQDSYRSTVYEVLDLFLTD
jgi:CubicO group peptidase (beta-lactamase class C family)